MKPTTIQGYDQRVTDNCERVLVTLLRGLGPWKESVYLIGGLAPRYIIPDRPPKVPPHAGTSDLDIVVELEMLAETEAYHSLEENLKKLGFERAENNEKRKLSWRWQTRLDARSTVILELLADYPNLMGGKVQPIPTERGISALNIPHASIVFDLHETVEITAPLLNDGGNATETIRYADLVSFTCLKAFAYNQRNERKDAHDLVYCLEHQKGGIAAAHEKFRAAVSGKHGAVIAKALTILETRFVGNTQTEGYLRDGPVSVAQFELGDDTDAEARDARILRQRTVSDLIQMFLAGLRQ